MDRAGVQQWLDAYIKAWKSYSPDAIGDLFAENATYSYHPYDEPVVGRAAIVASWLKDRDEPGTFDARYEPVAVDGEVTVAHGRSKYFKDASRTEQTKEWDNIFVIRFDQDGRCTSFGEWWVAPRGQT